MGAISRWEEFNGRVRKYICSQSVPKFQKSNSLRGSVSGIPQAVQRFSKDLTGTLTGAKKEVNTASAWDAFNKSDGKVTRLDQRT